MNDNSSDDKQKQYARLRELFVLLCDLPSAEQSAYLDKACANDPELRRQAEILLSGDAKGGLLEDGKTIDGVELHLDEDDKIVDPAEDPRLAATNLSAAEEAQELPSTRAQQHSPANMPKQIGRYKVLQEIGQGGMGSVYMAEQTEPVQRRVALKIIKAGMDSKEVIARFEAERQALAMMDHPNIAKVLDAGMTENRRPYFVMELVRGIPITHYCDKNRLTPDERLMIFIKVCRAIQHAHQKGIIHRDIKPSNVLVGMSDGEPVPKVIDFGLAKALQAQSLTDKTMFTQFGQVVGTLEYMSPEQAEMDINDVDTRTDVYSLGVLLYELLTGSTPIGRERLKSAGFHRLLQIIREEDAPRPSMRLSDSGDEVTGISEQRRCDSKRLGAILKGDLDWIAVKALDKDRKRRYEAASELAADIQRYLDDEAIEARPPTLNYRLRKTIRKHKGKFAAASVALSMLVAGLIGTGTMWYRAASAEKLSRAAEKKANDEAANTRKALAEVEKQRDRANANEALVAKEANRAQDAEAAAKFQLANARWDANRAGEAQTLLSEIPHKYRDNFEWHYCRRLFLGSDMTLYGHASAVWSVDFSPDGKLIASGDDDGAIKLWDASTGQEVTTLNGHAGAVRSVRFSPDGSSLASGSDDHTIKLWDANGNELMTLNGHSNRVCRVRFNPDGTRLVSASWDGTAKLWDAATGQELRTLGGDVGFVTCASFSRDGKFIAAGMPRLDPPQVKMWDVSSGQEVAPVKVDAFGISSLAFSPDGTCIAAGTENRTISMTSLTDPTEVSGDQPIKTFSGHHGRLLDVQFSPAGTCVASSSDDGTIKLWDVATGEELKSLKGHKGYVEGIAFSPDGARVVSGGSDATVKVWDLTGLPSTSFGQSSYAANVSFSSDGTRMVSCGARRSVRIWDAFKGQQLAMLSGHNHTVYDACFSPDRSRVASACRDRTVKLWDATTGEELNTLKGHNGSVFSVRFSPDGSKIASGSYDSTIRLWDTATGEQLMSLKGNGEQVWSVRFNREGERLVTGHERCIKLWDSSTGQELLTINRGAFSLAFSPDGTRIASGRYNSVDVWDASNGEQLMVLKGHTNKIKSVCFSPDGTRIASAGAVDKTIKLWDAATGEELLTLTGHTDGLKSVCFSPDGNRMASASYDGTIRLWEAPRTAECTTLSGHTASIYGARFSPDGDYIATVDYDGVTKLWDTASASELSTLRGHTGAVWRVRFSPGGTRVATASNDKTIKVWDIASGEELMTLSGHAEAVYGLAYSPDGKYIVSCGPDKTIKFWDANSGRESWTLKEHSDAVNFVSFSGNGAVIASASVDKTVKLWDVATHTLLQSLDGHTEPVFAVHFSQDGKRVYSQSDNERFVWNAKTGNLIPDAEWFAVNPQEHGRWQLRWSPISVLLIDKDYKRTRQAEGYLAFEARARPEWHQQQYERSLKAENHYAALFHAAWLFRLEPDSRPAYDQFHLSLAQVEEKDLQLLPKAIQLAIELPKPPVSEKTAQAENQRIWNKVLPPESQPTDLDLEWMHDIVQQYPRGIYFNTLAVTEFRAGNYKAAIAASLKSVELTPQQDDRYDSPYPGDFAVLAMSYLLLGDRRNANEYREKFTKAMKLDVFSDDEENLGFLREVNTHFLNQ